MIEKLRVPPLPLPLNQHEEEMGWIVARKLNEVIDVVNAMQSDIAFRSILKSVSSVDFMPPTGAYQPALGDPEE